MKIASPCLKSVGIFLLVVVLAGCGTKETTNKSETPLQQAHYYLDSWQIESAREAFDKLGREDRSQPWADYGEAMVFERQLLFYDALSIYFRLAKDHQDFAPGLEGMNRVLGYLDFPIDAILPATALTTLLPDRADYRYRLGDLYMSAGYYDRGMLSTERAIDLGVDPGTGQFQRARGLFLQNRSDSSNFVRDLALSAGGNSPGYFRGGADYFETVGLFDSAASWSSRSIDSTSVDFDNRVCHFQRMLRMNYFDRARRQIDEWSAFGADSLTLTVIEMFLSAARNVPSETRQHVDEIMRIGDKTISLLVYEIAVRAKIADVSTCSEDRNRLYHVLESENHSQAFADFMTYITEVHALTWAYNIGEYSNIEKIYGARADRRDVRIARAHSYQLNGQFDLFEKTISDIEKTAAFEPDWLTGLGDMFTDRQIARWSTAEEYYLRAIEADNSYRPALQKLVRLYWFLDRLDDAVKAVEGQHLLQKVYPSVSILRSFCLMRTGQFEKGLDIFEDKIPLIREDLTAFSEAAEILARLGNTDGIKRLGDILIKLNPGNAEALSLAAKLENDLGNYAQAEIFASKASELASTFIDARVQLARAYYGLDRKTEAFEIFEANYKLNHLHLDNNFFFSKSLMAEDIDIGNATRMAQMGLSHSLRREREWMHLCDIYFKVGRPDLVRGEALKSIQVYKNSPEPYYRLGKALFKEGKPEAKEKLQIAIDLGLLSPGLESAKEMISKL